MPNSAYVSYIVKIALTIAGLIFGSFVNAYVYRTKLAETKSGRNDHKESTNKRYSIISGRSVCPNCKHELKVSDLVPIISWLYLRGKCRYCHKPISVQYPLVELLTVSMFLFTLYFWPFNLSGGGLFLLISWLLILVNLIALAVYDIKYLTLPNTILVPVFILVLFQVVYRGVTHNYLHVSYANEILGFIFGGGIFYVIFQASRGKWIGGGDVKLGAVLGLMLGSATSAILMIFIASLLGSLVSIPFLLTKQLKRHTLIPFGPFLIAAAVILTLFSATIINWLKTKGVSL